MSSYGNQYNTRRQSGRYNTPGQFVPASSTATPPPPAAAAPPAASLSNMRLTTQINNLHTIQTTDIEMKPEPAVSESSSSKPGDVTDVVRPSWMKPKLAGVKKISNKERRRRQNANLRRLLTPKNALMVLNEMLPGEQLANQYSVESCMPYHAPNLYGKPAAFVAELKLQGNSYQGYGDTKMSARNAAAEQAIRDLVIRRMAADSAREAAAAAAGDGNGTTDGDGDGDGGEEQLPMMQLASFALHKLFSEWEFEGHSVPQLKAPKLSVSESTSTAGDDMMAGPARRPPRPPRAPKPPKTLPSNAGAMHPAMLLAYMRPANVYRDLQQEGDRPQNILFTVGVEVDGNTYCGKGTNKKEARRAAARAACEALFGVTFQENANDTKPLP